MKKFEFRLDSALRWRTTQFQLERVKLQTLLAEQARLNRDIEALAQERRSAVSGLQEMAQLESFDLRSLASYLVGAEFRHNQLQEQLARRKALTEQQRVRVMDAELQVRLLEKLKDKKQSEWKFEFEKDLDNNAAEAWLASHFGPSAAE